MVQRREFLKVLTFTSTGVPLLVSAADAEEHRPPFDPKPGTRLLEENWSGPGIDRERWSHAGDVTMVKLANGSSALRIGNSPAGWTNTIMTRQRFARGGNLRVTYKLWGEGMRPGGVDGLVPGPGSCVYGPWHNSFFELASYFTLEAGLTQGGNDFSFTENRNFRRGRLRDNDAFAKALARADSRDRALTIRIGLGDQSGAIFQWKAPGGTWQTSHDTRNTKKPRQRMTRAAVLREDVGHAAQAKIGFVTNQYTAYIAELVVETDLSADEYHRRMAALAPEPTRIVRKEAVPWTQPLRTSNPGFSQFQFAITSDLTGNYKNGVFELAIAAINRMKPDFAITVGDLVEGYVDNATVIRNEFEWFDAMAAEFEVPFLYVPGNHDVCITWKDNDLMLRMWRERYGRDFYHFIYKNVLFLCLNTNDDGHYIIRERQKEWALQTLDEHRDVQWTIVIAHDPLWEYQWDTGWRTIEDKLQKRPYTVFSGHYHRYTKFRRKGRDYYILAATGGATDDDRPVEERGGMDHFAWVTMTQDGPVVANVTLPGVLPDDIVGEAHQRAYLNTWSEWMEARAREHGLYKEAT